MNIHGFHIKLSYESSLWTASLKMAAERYLSRRIPDLRVGNNIDEIDKKLIPASIHPCLNVFFENALWSGIDWHIKHQHKQKKGWLIFAVAVLFLLLSKAGGSDSSVPIVTRTKCGPCSLHHFQFVYSSIPKWNPVLCFKLWVLCLLRCPSGMPYWFPHIMTLSVSHLYVISIILSMIMMIIVKI